jgi:hypothetical protein
MCCLALAFAIQLGSLPAEAATVTAVGALALSFLALVITISLNALDRPYLGTASAPQSVSRRAPKPTPSPKAD